MNPEKEITILPTHSCFDDCTKYLNDQFIQKHITYLSVCHGVCILPHENIPFAHSWIMNQEVVLGFGLVEGKIHIVKYKRDQFFEKFNVRWFRQYSLSEAIACQTITQCGPPWDNELRELCKDKPLPIKKDLHKLVSLFGKIWRLK